MSVDLPVDVLLNHTPTSPHLRMNLVQFPQFPLLPFLAIDIRIDEVYPFLSALDFGSVEASFPKLFCDSFPALGGELRVKDGEEFDLLNEGWMYLGGP